MIKRLLVSLVLIVSGIAAGLVLSGWMRATDETALAPVPTTSVRAPQTPAAAPLARAPDFSDVAARAVTGVVNVSSLQVARTRRSPFFDDPFFRYFFGDEFGDENQRSLSLGSGVIISSDGYVVTNNHVVAGNGGTVREINAVLPDKRQVRGTLVATDPMTDVALLKIDVTNGCWPSAARSS